MALISATSADGTRREQKFAVGEEVWSGWGSMGCTEESENNTSRREKVPMRGLTESYRV